MKTIISNHPQGGYVVSALVGHSRAGRCFVGGRELPSTLRYESTVGDNYLVWRDTVLHRDYDLGTVEIVVSVTGPGAPWLPGRSFDHVERLATLG